MAAIRTVEVIGGSGTVCRRGDVIVWLGVDVSDSTGWTVVTAIDSAGRQAVGATRLLPEVCRALAGASDAELGSFAVVAPSATGVSVILHGSVRVGNERSGLDGTWHQPLTTSELAADGFVAVFDPSDSLVPWRTSRAQRIVPDLRDGIVPGGGFRANLASAAPAPVPDLDRVVLIDISSPPAEPREPLPIVGGPHDPSTAPVADRGSPTEMVRGFLCGRGHFNHPDAFYCATCGLGMAQQTRVLVEATRPSLGVLVLDHGTTFGLDGDYILGREPDMSQEVRTGSARALPIGDSRVSRRHARVSLLGWDVVVTDLGSANGTYVLNPDDSQWVTVPPGQHVTLRSGGRVSIGNTVLVYESTHGR